ncbi:MULTISPECIES: OsmC family protein [Priestia]|uniref:OsmC family protein n=1 Tax=Priestia TaxID=2800373 RepID=UPI0013E30BAA|nr:MULTISPECIES: OsmC family protein [Priestia]MBE5099204.1 OsmC family protein [Priestia aryabhattai]MBU8689871.1 OsmC family protein [Priestia megaterium]MDI3090940.1 OsmC family protein [Priestia megaterium]MEC1070325.1 OsmC family protein [Priestia megaterium]MED3865319.1 OsmC family protein [Priestia megaterium]
MEFNMKKEAGFTTNFPYGELHIAGDEEYGFRPYQLMVSSIAVCSGGVLRKILEKKRIAFSDLRIQADVTRNDEKAGRIEKIHLHYIITGEDLPLDKIEKSVELARKNCSMLQSVVDSIEVTETFETK